MKCRATSYHADVMAGREQFARQKTSNGSSTYDSDFHNRLRSPCFFAVSCVPRSFTSVVPASPDKENLFLRCLSNRARLLENGRARCRERVWQYVEIWVGG